MRTKTIGIDQRGTAGRQPPIGPPSIKLTLPMNYQRPIVPLPPVVRGMSVGIAQAVGGEDGAGNNRSRFRAEPVPTP